MSGTPNSGRPMDIPAEPAETVSTARWFARGAQQFLSIPAMILMASFVGFAGLARASGIGLVETVVMAGGIWALPSCVVLVGAVQTGAPLAATFIAVSLSAFRLMPMVMSIVPVMRAERTSKLTLLFLSHFVAVTAWVFGMAKLPGLPREARAAYFAGFAVTLTTGAMIVAGVSHELAGALPPLLAAGLTLLTPLYFTVSLWGAARLASDRLALAFGVATWPAMHWLEPNFELIWTGLIGGTAAFLVGRRIDAGRRRRVPADTENAGMEVGP